MRLGATLSSQRDSVPFGRVTVAADAAAVVGVGGGSPVIPCGVCWRCGAAPWSACGQRGPQNSGNPGTTCMYFRRSGRCTPTKIELLRRVSAVRIEPGASRTDGGQA